MPRSLSVPKKRHGGRNNQGLITARHRGGGHKRRYRLVDFRREKDGVPAKVHSIQYDPNRSARIALLHYADGEKRFILAPEGLKVGQEIMNGPDAPPAVGNCLPMRNIPLGLSIHNVELQPGRGAGYADRPVRAGSNGPRGGLAQIYTAQRRNSARTIGGPRDDWRDRQCRSYERCRW